MGRDETTKALRPRKAGGRAPKTPTGGNAPRPPSKTLNIRTLGHSRPPGHSTQTAPDEAGGVKMTASVSPTAPSEFRSKQKL
jgi:hypothetical protein